MTVRVAIPPGACVRMARFAGMGRAGGRNRAMFELMWRAGLRTVEVLGQRAEHIERRGSRAVVFVSRPKGMGTYGEHRAVGIDEEAASILDALIQSRGGKPGLLFTTSSGNPVLSRYLRRKVAEWGRYAGIPEPVFPHRLRHAFARDLIDEGFNVREIQVALGHNHLSTTDVYLRSIGQDHVTAKTLNRERSS